jgi:hypothetical protein
VKAMAVNAHITGITNLLVMKSSVGTAHQRTRPQLVHGNFVIQTAAKLSCILPCGQPAPVPDIPKQGDPANSTNETLGEAKVAPKESTTSYRVRRGLL